GDEFIIVLNEITEPQDAAQVAQKIIDAMVEPVPCAGKDLKVTMSSGITVYPTHGDDDVQALMKKADMAMYEAKSAGRNAYSFFASSNLD
ncbi:MAG: hypothetical protein FD135_2915, partial [Comamonadaceae bacterium]